MRRPHLRTLRLLLGMVGSRELWALEGRGKKMPKPRLRMLRPLPGMVGFERSEILGRHSYLEFRLPYLEDRSEV